MKEENKTIDRFNKEFLVPIFNALIISYESLGMDDSVGKSKEVCEKLKQFIKDEIRLAEDSLVRRVFKYELPPYPDMAGVEKEARLRNNTVNYELGYRQGMNKVLWDIYKLLQASKPEGDEK